MSKEIWIYLTNFYNQYYYVVTTIGFIILVLIGLYLHRKKIKPQIKNFEEGSFLKTWAIPLPFFHFHHEPYRRESSHRNFIGRNELSRKFLAILQNSQNSSGSYLITGYRGVGKTSFVKKVLEDYKNGSADVGASVHYSSLYDIYLFLVKKYGQLSLKLHKWVYKTEEQINHSAFFLQRIIKYLSFAVKPFNKKHRFITLSIFSFVFLFVFPPENRYIHYFFFLIFLLVALKLYDLFGMSIVSPRQWWRWLFHPVLLLQINLGHERLDTKQLLFDITSLLNIRYRKALGFLSYKLVNIVVLLILATISTHFAYRIWKDDIGYIEAELQNSIFTIYQLNPETERKFNLKQKLNGEVITLEKWIKDTEKNENQLNSETIFPTQDNSYGAEKNAYFTNNLNFTIKEKKKSWSNLKKIYGEVYLSRAEFEKALISVIGEEAKNRHILKLLSYGDISNKYTASRASDFCKKIRIDSLNDKNKAKNNKAENNTAKETIFKADASLSQHIYCSLNKLLQDAYYWAWKGYPLQNKKFWIKDKDKDCKGAYCKSWFSYIREFLLEHLFLLTTPNGNSKGNSDRTIEQVIQENTPRPYSLFVYFVSLLFIYILYRLLFSLGPGRVLRRLEYMHKRIIASADDIELGSGVLMSGLSIRRNKKYHPLDSRQAEFLLLDILETNHRLWRWVPHPEFIFVFDELDKIDPANDQSHQQKNKEENELLASSPGDSIRRRKFEVEQLLSNLKNIITVAPSRFIFIAGRDMMDANLADQGEVNHLYSSLFDETLYIPSFLTDYSDKEEEDISSMVEQYVCRRLLPRSIAYYLYSKNQDISVSDKELELEYKCWSLEIYLCYLKELDEDKKENWEELAIFLLDFIYYLTYRSAGSPKKLSLQFEEFVIPMPKNILLQGDNKYYTHPPITLDTRFTLKFNAREQYQIQMISHIFILLHGETSHLIRQYGDKLSLSTFSILDYIFKYHSIAFSARDLERMPDVLDIHRAPALPQVIDVLLNKMLTPYLQNLDNGVYEYRFLQNFQREIVYISQFSERDLAAFNFTLDESINIKQHYRNLLKRQMRFQKGYHLGIKGSSKESETWHTLPSLHVILGDISTLDRDFSDALTEYRNALQYLEPALEVFDQPHDKVDEDYEDRKNKFKVDRDSKAYWEYPAHQPVYKLATSMNQLLLYVQILLKIGLLAERRNQFDNASAHYFHAYRVVDHIMKSRLGRRYIIPNFSLLPLLYQPYICLAYIHVKRDLLPDSAENLLGRASEKFERYMADSTKRQDSLFKKHIEPSKWQQAEFQAKITINWAELLLEQSRFKEAGFKYLEVIENILCIAFENNNKDKLFQKIRRIIRDKGEQNQIIHKNILGSLAKALSGLGDISCGLYLRDYYEAAEDVCGLEIPSKQWKDFINKDSGCGLNELDINKIDEIKIWGIYFYLMSAEIYKLNNSSAKAVLSLWKIENLLSYGFSFEDLYLLKNKHYRETNKEDLDWLFGSELENLAESAFEASYITHRKRLIKIGVKESLSKNWIAPPLKQTSMVLRKFWKQEIIEDFQLKHMGAFPIHTRILAGYLKALSYYIEITNPDPIQNKWKSIAKMFFLLVQSAEEGSAYEGGIDLLSPHLGAIYYLLWKVLIEFREPNKTDFKKFVNEDIEFIGEKRRFLSEVYCRTRAYRLLSDIVGRHTRDSAFTRYINRRYYLHGGFSDSYAQGIWSIDYAICPVVERMLADLDKGKTKSNKTK